MTKEVVLHATQFDMAMIIALSKHFPDMTAGMIARLAFELGLVRLLDTYVNPAPKPKRGRPFSKKKPRIVADKAPKMIGDTLDE